MLQYTVWNSWYYVQCAIAGTECRLYVVLYAAYLDQLKPPNPCLYHSTVEGGRRWMIRENRRKQKKRKGFRAKEKQPCKKWQLALMPFSKKNWRCGNLPTWQNKVVKCLFCKISGWFRKFFPVWKSCSENHKKDLSSNFISAEFICLMKFFDRAEVFNRPGVAGAVLKTAL